MKMEDELWIKGDDTVVDRHRPKARAIIVLNFHCLFCIFHSLASVGALTPLIPLPSDASITARRVV
jgi:hypothetical protein